jgi:GAF domain-containing protein
MWDQRAPEGRNDEIGLLSLTFNQMAEDLSQVYRTLESQVQERTESLSKRSRMLEASAVVSRKASSELNPDNLIKEVVGLIQEEFDLYYVGLFLLDEDREWAQLRAGTGEAGKKMIDRRHRIKVGEGMIGWCIANARSRVAMKAEMDDMRLETPELPDTRSEAAIPLQARQEVIGAITVQGVQEDAFDETTITTLQTLADLVSIAIDNARLYSQSQENIKNLQKAYAQFSPETWRELLKGESSLSYYCDDSGLQTLENIPDEYDSNEFPEIEMPITIRGGQVIGKVKAHKTQKGDEWNLDEISVMETLIESLSSALESAQLFQETQRRAGLEQITREVSSKMRESLDFESVIQTAATELRKALNLSEVEIRMGTIEE